MAEGPKQKSSIPLIGALALKNQLVTKAELEAGLTQCKNAKNPDDALKAYFLSQELISNKNIQRLTLAAKAITIRQKEYKFGAIAVAKGFINKSVLDLALEDQENDLKSRQKPRLIGDMMVEAGLLTEKQRDYILKLQNRVKKSSISETAGDADTAGPDKAAPGGDQEKDAAAEAPALLEPEIIVGGIKLEVASDLMAAFLSKTKSFDEDVTTGEIKEVLFDKGIISGMMSDEMVDGFIASTGFKTQSFRVAKGIRPIQGQDARVEFFFNTDYLKAGGMDEDGNIDFKQRGEIPLVEKGTVLAEKTPVVESRCGQNIYGDEVSTEKGDDVALKFGNGAVLSEDGLKILANVRGYPKYSLAGVVYVHDIYTAAGDVDFETGHIEFDGNVHVKGCIKAGFKVKGNDVSSAELDGGIVEADGDLKVNGGINEGRIYARGSVYAKFIHSSEIVCMGDVHVQKEIVDSTIEASGACVIDHGKLISSRVTAKMGLSARNVGTEMSSPSTIKVGHDAFTEKEIKKNRARVAALKKEIAVKEEKKAGLKSENAELQKKITELAHVQDRAQLEQRDVEQQMADPANAGEKDGLNTRFAQLKARFERAEHDLDDCFEQSESLEEAMKAIDEEINHVKTDRDNLVEERNNLAKWAKENPGKAQVSVEGAIRGGSVIIGKHSELTVNKTIRHARISEVLFQAGSGDSGRTVYQMKVGNF